MLLRCKSIEVAGPAAACSCSPPLIGVLACLSLSCILGREASDFGDEDDDAGDLREERRTIKKTEVNDCKEQKKKIGIVSDGDEDKAPDPERVPRYMY
jgi:hypothetical protein